MFRIPKIISLAFFMAMWYSSLSYAQLSKQHKEIICGEYKIIEKALIQENKLQPIFVDQDETGIKIIFANEKNMLAITMMSPNGQFMCVIDVYESATTKLDLSILKENQSL